MDAAEEHRLIENALKGLVKLVKAGRFYPARHPALGAAAEEAKEGFLPLLGDKAFFLTVRKEGFLLDDKVVAPENAVLKNLALLFFARRILRLTILPDLSTRDLHRFARGLALDPGTVQKRGGFQEVLLKSRVTTIWVNEVDLSRIHERKEELEEEQAAMETEEDELDLPEQEELPAEGAEQPDSEDSQLTLSEILDLLDAERDEQRYRQLSQEAVARIPEQLNPDGRNQVVRAFTLLCRDASREGTSPDKAGHARHALDQLTTPQILAFFSELLCLRGLPQNMRERLVKILVMLGEKAVRHLMDRLAAERDAAARRVLAEALIRHGRTAVPVLAEYLKDDRWYVVRNAVGILGEIRDQEVAGALPPLLQHQDLRVRRETIRALTRIGGSEAEGILLRTVEQGDADMRRQALLSLGAMRSVAAVPVLLALLVRPDATSRNIEVSKEAIKALGEIGSPEAVPTLTDLLRRRSF